MAVSFLEESHRRFEKATIFSNPEHLPASSEVMELALVDDVKESNECKHFTIRGYVTEVRKRDAKKCFPFLLHNCASLEPGNAFPPLAVSKFRRWGCQNCVYEILATTCQMDSEAMSIHNNDVNSNNILFLGKDAENSQLDERKTLSRLPQYLNENHKKEKSEVKDCSVNIDRVGKEGLEFIRCDQIKEDIQKSKNGQGSEAQSHDAIKVNCLSYGHDAVNRGRRGKYRNSDNRKTLGVAYVKDAVSSALVRHKRSKSQKVGHSKMLDGNATSIRINFRLCCSKEDRRHERKVKEKLTSNTFSQGHKRIDVIAKKDDIQDALSAHNFSLGASCHDRKACRVSVDNLKCMDLTDGEHQMINEFENIHVKKIQKVRLLEDILRSEQHVTGVRHILDVDSKDIHDFMSRATSKEKVLLLKNKSQDAHHNNISKYVRGKSKIQNSFGEDMVQDYKVAHINGKYHCVHERNKLSSFKRENIHENHSEYEGPRLMHWVNNMPKKINAYGREAITQHINTNFFLSDFSFDLLGGKDQDLDVRDNGMTVRKQKSSLNRKENSALERGQMASSIMIREEMKSKKSLSWDICTSKNVDNEKKCGSSDGTGRDAILHSMANKRPYRHQVINYNEKDSFLQNTAPLKVWEQVLKKPKSNRINDHVAVDDIPMNIVELLAMNQQEIFPLKAEIDSINSLKFPAMTESIKCSVDLDSSLISRNNATDTEQGRFSSQTFQPKNKGFDVWTTFPCNSNIEDEPKGCNCSIIGEKKLLIDLNQHHSDSLIGGAGFCKDINMNRHQLNFSSCRRNNVHFLQSFLEDQTTSSENLSKTPSHNVLQHSNGGFFGGKSHFLNNSKASVLGSNLEKFAHSNDSEKLRNGKHHHWCSSPASPNAFSFTDVTNSCHSNFSPAYLYNNETISALNLLRLMDQTACSGEPWSHFQRYPEVFKETAVCVNCQYNESRLEYGNQEKKSCISSFEIVNPTQQQPKNSCLLFRPLPRIGSLEPSLQKEIFNYSNYSSIPTKNSSGFLKTDAKERIKSHLDPTSFVCNSDNSLFRCKCSENICSDRDPDRCSASNTRCSIAKIGATQVELNNQVDALLPFESFCKMEICVLNRNPAEFTVLDENNEYMIEIKGQKLKSLPPSLHGPLHGQKRQRVMKLNDLKAFAM